ncbi:hypothetical protein [Neoroseomonas soli]|uniref:HlyD family efflux transporter periplasmic adaptor subunit n=1 Tax=Neoroseomonas soli TaxID=1081025 RepID=A0A9X9X2V4_9PROT|nr:hypothetical protein [Neoroseomonas soli]MBR0673733.1 hypothetical protein [Neoroseomonas soli]
MPHSPRARLKLAAIIALPLLGLGACASTPPQPVTPPAPTVVSTAKEAVGVVERVDARTRQVTIRTPSEGRVTVTAGPDVQNFAQIRRGNHVRVRFEEAVAVQLAPRGTSLPPEEAVGVARAETGQRPAGAVVRTTRATVTVNSVDATNNTVTFTGPRGVRRTVAVRSPEMQAFIRTVRPGQQVNVVIAEAMALSVEPANQ